MKRSVIITICIVIACVAAFGCTFAYLTDTSGDTNVFTMGSVEITLDEAAVDENGVALENADRVLGNEYKLVPGKSYLKDPTVTVKKGSDLSYIRAFIVISNASAYLDMVKEENASADHSLFFPELNGDIRYPWVYEKEYLDLETNTLTIEYRHGEKVEAEEEDKVLSPLFTVLVVPGNATSEQMRALNSEETPFKVTVIANAIQQAGFENANAAWAAFDMQMTVDSGVDMGN